MSLIVETGQGLPDAESWASVADADAYHQARGNAGWTGEPAAKEAALRRGTDYLDGLYRARWLGRPVVIGQALGWPRAYAASGTGYLPSDKIPVALLRACCECALRELESPGGLAPDFVPGEQIVSETVGPLSVDYAGSAGSAPAGDQMPRLPAVERLLAPLMRSGAAACLVLRA